VTVLVTGAAGFVGAHLIHKLSARGNHVIGVDNYNGYYSPELKTMRVEALVPADVEIINLDLADAQQTKKIVDKIKPKTVYHLAAQAGVRLNLDDTQLYVQSNLVGFSNILQAAIQSHVTNFLYASSSSVYGNSVNIPYAEDDRNLSPISFYGASKLSNELLASALVRGTATKARGLRFFTVFGPWGRPDMAYLRIAETLINGHEFRLFGTGDAVRDFTYIDDTVHATVALGEQLDVVGIKGFADVVNIGGGKPSSMLELIEAFETVSGKSMKLARSAQVDKDVDKTVADYRYLKSLINFTPKIELRDGVERVFNWSTSHGISSKLDSWTKSVN
jgi:UDP-glucuronate 4-epimerase